ncbi:MAG: 1-deoxy-D-xylulose-5-phosphate reductoisomerase [Candidatus Cloacimonetes bacterium]|nr:1-deoxy-D-xylulose-5-phosphate reductoisomerase [Candidatus Cloacimonadota bacterium]
MQTNLTILGATGSIGSTCLDLIRQTPGQFRLKGVSANTSVQKMVAIVHEFKPEFIHMMEENPARELRTIFPNLKISSGMPDLLDWLGRDEEEIVLAAMVGNVGLQPVLKALKANKTVALANKETLVSAGHLVKEALRLNPKSQIIPVDSEHSAIHQCLRGENRSEIENVILTASGGSFRTYSLERMKSITPSEACKHPNWDMGAKITVDSSTLMNKGLEVIEAHWLFDIPYEQIQVIVHPQSIIHSLVSFVDGAVMAQMGNPDMIAPISYALNRGISRCELKSMKRLDLAGLARLDFEEPDLTRFPNLGLAFFAGKAGGSLPCVLNASNEEAVSRFLKNQIGFLDIARINQKVVERHKPVSNPGLEEILKIDQWAREEARQTL